MNNKVFYQHPNLMRVLGMHETVMEVMVNVLGGDKSQVRLCCVKVSTSQAVHQRSDPKKHTWHSEKDSLQNN